LRKRFAFVAGNDVATSPYLPVMAGLVPAIHVFLAARV
jgi:hypothetical protein